MTTKNQTAAVSRRKFLQSAAVAAIAPSLLVNSFTASAKAPGTKLRHACIGVGGMGGVDLSNFKSHRT